jgi:hypothetical protein
MNQNDPMKYYIAAEKIQNLIYTIEITLQFMEEFQIAADEEVKAAIMPAIEKLKGWVK